MADEMRTYVADYLSTAGVGSYTVEQVGSALAAEQAAQSRACRVPDDSEWPDGWPADLLEALCRRVARNLYLRALPSGLATAVGDGTVTQSYVGSDAETRRLEAPWRKVVLG